MEKLNFPIWVVIYFGAIAAFGAITDYRTGKIYNFTTLPSILLGVAVASFYFGIKGFTYSLAALGLATLIFFPLYWLKIFGAGDAKLIMALATVLGVRELLEMTYICFITGGTAAALLLIKHGRVKIFFKEVKHFLKSLVYPGLAIQWPRLNRKIRAPFGAMILVGYLWVVIVN